MEDGLAKVGDRSLVAHQDGELVYFEEFDTTHQRDTAYNTLGVLTQRVDIRMLVAGNQVGTRYQWKGDQL